MADEPDLVRDGRDNDRDWVRFLQQTLEYWGYWSHEHDGDFTEALDDAVRTFQEDNGLNVDGWIGRKTWSVMHREAVVIDFDHFPKLREHRLRGGRCISCRDERLAYDAARAGAATAIGAAMIEAGSAAGSPAPVPTIGAAVGAGAAAVTTGISLAECLEDSGETAEAERLLRDVEELGDEIDQLRELGGVG